MALTSFNDFIVFILASIGFASCGTNKRTADILSMFLSLIVNSLMLPTHSISFGTRESSKLAREYLRKAQMHTLPNTPRT